MQGGVVPGVMGTWMVRSLVVPHGTGPGPLFPWFYRVFCISPVGSSRVSCGVTSGVSCGVTSGVSCGVLFVHFGQKCQNPALNAGLFDTFFSDGKVGKPVVSTVESVVVHKRVHKRDISDFLTPKPYPILGARERIVIFVKTMKNSGFSKISGF